MSDAVSINVDLSSLGPEAQVAFTPNIADAFLETAVMGDKYSLVVDRKEIDDPTVQYLLDAGYMEIAGETDDLYCFEITDAGKLRGAEIVQSRFPSL